jgi:diguanylate cyclase (GGDEF)-like protein
MHGKVDAVEDRRERARTIAWLFLSGAGLSATLVVLPGWDEMADGPLLGTVVAAALVAVVVWSQADRMGRVSVHAVAGCGVALIAICQLLAGGGTPTAMYAMLYLWVVLHAAMFFTWHVAAAHVVFSSVAHATVLVVLGEMAGGWPQLAVVAGTQVAACAVVGQLAARLRRSADVDGLTGLTSRRMVERALAWACEQTCRHGRPLTVALIDLDGFKQINDRDGHQAGDELLVEIARRWVPQVRASDLLGRVGGDEFALIATGCDLDAACELVDRLLEVLPGTVGASAGVAQFDGHEAPQQLMGRADQALYAAKASERRVVVDEPAAV